MEGPDSAAQRRNYRSASVPMCKGVNLERFWRLPIAPACTDRFFDDVPNYASAFSVGDGLVDQVDDIHR
jgi:hypothetical protein